ncbi:MAG: 2-C-methyl-D-erythritol 4-phosphate cytidylyltransferase [Bacilli bacterium]|nr:2-C-methyl-D-erythritol 4-phosphate cytidylyltransferase [Bacilli bacterium]MDD4809349.1 2-C-methyl-D-erythritol 4-phosphate cytidylyltransferase [Bacilli bacterium]
MIYGIILAGGSGTRMGLTDKPKQFLLLNNIPIFIYAVQQLKNNNKINKIIICAPKKWHSFIIENLQTYFSDIDNIKIIESGHTRNETMMNGCDYIEKHYGIKDNDLVITHDSVRPFITQKMINDNIKGARKYSAVTTVSPAVDTMIISTNEKTITNIPTRNNIFHAQTPQTFNLRKLISLYNKLNKKEKNIITDGSSIFTINNETVYLVDGDSANIKITTKNDLLIAEAIIKTR